jgi:hypothetical protein
MIVYGSVTLNGSPAADGYNITAWNNGALVGSILTSGGNYSIQVCGAPGQTCSSGNIISFQLAQLTTTQTATFTMGSSVNLNLAFTGTPNQQAQVQQATSSTTAQSNQTQVVTVVTTVSTPEYPDFAIVALVGLLITLITVVTLGRKRKTQ